MLSFFLDETFLVYLLHCGALLTVVKPVSMHLQFRSIANPAGDVVSFIHQVASQPDATVERLQSELLRWEEQYQASTAAAGPAKWRLRSAFLSGTYASLLRSVQERRAAEERARTSEVNRHNREVRLPFVIIAIDVCG